MSLLGQSRHIQRTPKTNFVRYAPNSDHSTAEFVCRLSANSGLTHCNIIGTERPPRGDPSEIQSGVYS
jgi:hypothetical protein